MSKILLVSLVHNRKGLVGQALQSAVNQTLSKNDWIHLVWDNASTDGADKIAKAFCNKHSNMKFYRCDKNLGQQRAYNEILNNWIPKNMPDVEVMTVLDSDDTLTPMALHEVNKMYDAHPEIGASYSGFSLVDRKGRFIAKDHPKARMMPKQFTKEGQKALRQRFVGSNPCGHLRAYRIKALVDIGGFNTGYEYATDYSIFGRMMEKYPVVKIDKVLYHFRQHGDQVQGHHSPQQTKDWQDMQKEFTSRWKKMGLI